MDIHADVFAAIADDTLVISFVQRWATEFGMERKSLEDGPRSGRPANTTTKEKH